MMKRTQNTVAGTIKSCGPGTPPYSSRRKLFMECRVAGAIYHNVEDVWDELCIGMQLKLVRQPDNIYDRNAVGVSLTPNEEDIIGYVPRTDNAALAVLMDMGHGALFEAEISGMKSHGHSYDSLSVAIYVKMDEEMARILEEKEKQLRLLELDDDSWEDFRAQLWRNGCAVFRWGGFPPWETDLPEKRQKVVFLHRAADNAATLYLMAVVATGNDAAHFVKDTDYLDCTDDCGPYVLTNIEGPVRAPATGLDFLDGVETDHWQPDFLLSPGTAEKLMALFPSSGEGQPTSAQE